MPKAVIEKITDKKLKKLCAEYFNSIAIAKRINNVSKHTLNIWTTENLTPNCINTIDYVIKYDGREVSASSLISLENEKKTEHLIIKILDYIFTLNITRKVQRKYVRYYVDVESFGDVETVCDLTIEDALLISVHMDTEKQNDGTYINKNIKMVFQNKPQNEIELASCYDHPSMVCNISKVGVVNFDCVDVFVNNQKIGSYILEDAPKVSYLHFKKYSLKLDK